MPNVTVAICTRNRPHDLAASLATVWPDVRRTPDVELLIVDNGDGVDAPPGVRVVREPVPGVARARNRALDEAAGEVLLFTDDDVRVPPGWVTAMTEPVLRREADAVAGAVVLAPHLQHDWLTPDVRLMLAESRLLHSEYPPTITINMAVRLDLAREIRFAADLGAGEDVFFYYGLRQRDARIAVCELPVEHHLDPARLERRSLWRMAERVGQNEARIARKLGGPVPHLRRTRRVLFAGAGAVLRQVPRRGLSPLDQRVAQQAGYFSV